MDQKKFWDISHHEVQKIFRTIPDVLTIHDNVLIHALDLESHNIALDATLKKAKQINITFKLSEATICESTVSRSDQRPR